MEFFRGEVRYVKRYPFAMKPWEVRIYHRSFPLCAFSAKSIGVADGEPVTEWKDSSAEVNHVLLPLWFRAWLWLRTVVARLKQRSMGDE